MVRSPRQVLVLASLLVFVDALMLGQGVISIFLGLGLLFIGLPRVLLRKYAGVRLAKLGNLACYLGAIAVVLVLNQINISIAANRADGLVAAVKGFHARDHRYPDSLEALVPEFIERVPRAKYTLLYADFAYIKSDSGALLYYIERPPFGRRTFDFGRDAWRYVD